MKDEGGWEAAFILRPSSFSLTARVTPGGSLCSRGSRVILFAPAGRIGRAAGRTGRPAHPSPRPRPDAMRTRFIETLEDRRLLSAGAGTPDDVPATVSLNGITFQATPRAWQPSPASRLSPAAGASG